jgi:hypothetical protein
MVKSEQNVKSAIRGVSSALDSSASAAENAGRAAQVLADKFVRGLGAAAAVGVAKILADQIGTVNDSLQRAASSADQALDQFSRLAQANSLEESAAQAQTLSSAASAINAELAKMESNRLTNFVAGITGAREEMEKLAKSLQTAADFQKELAAAQELARTKELSGLSEEEKKRKQFQNSLEDQKNKALAGISDPAARDRAAADLDAANKMKLSEFDAKGAEASDRKARDEQVKSDDARRSRDMKEFQDALDEQNEETARQSAKALEKALEDLEIQAQVVELNAERLDLQGQMGDLQKERSQEVARADAESLGASTAGRQALTSAQRKQAARNRQDNFRFEQENLLRRTEEMNAQSQAQANELMALRDLRSREGSGAMDRTGRSVSDRIAELEKSDLIDRSFGAKRFSTAEARRRIAEEEAARNDPSMRETSQDRLASIDERMKEVRQLLSKNLETLTNFNTSN